MKKKNNNLAPISLNITPEQFENACNQEHKEIINNLNEIKKTMPGIFNDLGVTIDELIEEFGEEPYPQKDNE